MYDTWRGFANVRLNSRLSKKMQHRRWHCLTQEATKGSQPAAVPGTLWVKGNYVSMTQSLTLDLLIRGICMMRGDLFLNSHCSTPPKSMAHCFWPMNYLYSNHMSHRKRVWLSGGGWTEEAGNVSLAWDPTSGCSSASQLPNEVGISKYLHIQDTYSPSAKAPKVLHQLETLLLLTKPTIKTQDPTAQREVSHGYER